MDGHCFSRALDTPEPLHTDPPAASPPQAHEAASDPETQAELLLALADEHPQEVLDNPVLPLLGLWDPVVWRRITSVARIRLATSRIVRAVEGASRETLRGFSLDCAGRVLPLWELRYPGSGHLRAALDDARAPDPEPTPRWLSAWERREALLAKAMLQPTSHLLDGSPIDDVALVLLRALEATRTRNPGRLRQLALDVAWATASATVQDAEDEAPRADEMEWLARHIEARSKATGG